MAMSDMIAIGSAAMSTLLTVILGLAQAHWRRTLQTLDERFAYERAKLDHIAEEQKVHAVQMARFEAVTGDVFRRLESMEEDFGVFRRELINISQSQIRIETLIRKSTPPPRGG